MSVELAEEAVTVRLAGGVSASPIVNGMEELPFGKECFWSAIADMVGAELTGVVVAGQRKSSMASPSSAPEALKSFQRIQIVP